MAAVEYRAHAAQSKDRLLLRRSGARRQWYRVFPNSAADAANTVNTVGGDNAPTNPSTSTLTDSSQRLTNEVGEPPSVNPGVVEPVSMTIAHMTTAQELLDEFPQAQIIFIDAISDALTPAQIAEAFHSARAPLVLCQVSSEASYAETSGYTDDSVTGLHTATATWFREALGDGRDSELDPAYIFNQSGLANSYVHSQYRTWATILRKEPELRDSRLIRIRLDRHDQRGSIQYSLSQSISSKNQRVTATIACGSEHDMVEHFPDQIWDTCKRFIKEAEVQRLGIRFPRATHRVDDKSLELALRSSLELPDRPLKDALRRFTKDLPRERRRVLLLYWNGIDRSDWDRAARAAWAAHVSALGRACPRQIRILAILLLQSNTPIVDAAEIANMADHHGHAGCTFVDLKPLARVPAHELRDSLIDLPHFPQDDESFRRELASLIHDETGGQFNRAVTLLERGVEGTWESLLASLKRRGQSPPSAEC